jgi:hypothetical protein
MKRRTFLIGTGSAAIGGSALLGSGAFTRVESQRSVTVQVAEDPNAYLGMDKCPESPNASYAWLDDNGHLELLMNPENPTVGESPLGEGVNSDSTTYFDSVFQLCNQGKEDVCVYIEDSEDWPTVPEGETDAGERRVDFYLEGDETQSIVGEDNAVPLPLGECLCVGLLTRTYGLSDGDELLAALDNEVRIVADVDIDCGGEEPPEALCPVLSGEYECTTYAQENGDWQRTGTRFLVENTGPVAAMADIAVANDPADWREGVTVGSNVTLSTVTDASVPQASLLIWEVPEECIEQEGFQTWGEYKQATGVADLTDWYETFGTGGPPAGAPADLDDGTVVTEQFVPERDTDPANTVGPDESIPDDQYPSMSDEAAAEGWTTCGDDGDNGECLECSPGGDAGRLSQLTIRNDGGERTIRVEDRGPPGQGQDNIDLFDDTVAAGEEFTVFPRVTGPPNLRFYIDGEPTEVSQADEWVDDFHISCSVEIDIEQEIPLRDEGENALDSLTVVAAVERGGSPIC